MQKDGGFTTHSCLRDSDNGSVPHGAGASTSEPHASFSSVGCLYLVGVCVEIKVFKEAGCKFTEEEVVGLVDCPHAPVRVVVGAGAGTEGPHCQGKREHALSVPAGRNPSANRSSCPGQPPEPGPVGSTY